MSARVFNPLAINELRRIRNNPQPNSTSSVDGLAVVRVKRNLFGPINHEETRAFVDKQLAEIHARDQEKWGFDFMKEKPVSTSKYVWERISPRKDSVPQAYALRRLPYLHSNSEDAAKGTVKSSRTTVVKQSHITDFLKNRKRNSSKVLDISVKTTDKSLPSKKKRSSDAGS